MVHGRNWTGLSLVMGVAAAAGFATSPAVTQAQDVPPVNTGAISLEVGADVVSEYWFRGIAQHQDGFIFQPYARLDVELGEFGAMQPTLYLGTWNSFHDRSLATGERAKWYESSFFAGVAAEVFDGLIVDLGYVNYRAPWADTTMAQEVVVGVAFDDSDLMEQYGVPVALQPHALLAIEFQGPGRDNTAGNGTYLELGLTPSVDLIEGGDFPLTFSIPMTAGFSVNNYYRDAAGDESTWGYFDIGFEAGVPLRFLPREYGDWAASAGVHLLWLGDSARRIADERMLGNDQFNVYGTVGFSLTY